MSDISLLQFNREDDGDTIRSKLNRNFSTLFGAINGGIDASNLDSAFQITVDKIQNALNVSGGTLRGPIECDKRNGAVTFDGVDLANLDSTVDEIEKNIIDFMPVSCMIDYTLSITDTAGISGDGYIEAAIAVPTGFNCNNMIFIASWPQFSYVGFDDLNEIRLTAVPNPQPDQVKIKVKAEWTGALKTLDDQGQAYSGPFEIRTQCAATCLFFRKGVTSV